MTTLAQPIEKIDGCVASALAVLGNKWTALIIKELTSGPQRFSGLERLLPGISPRTLSQRLDDLAQHEIVTRQVFAEVPPRCEYALTEKGQALIPILRQMAAWGEQYPSGCSPETTA